MDEIHVNNIKEINFHPILNDIENIFWFFILSNAALANPKIQEEIRNQNESNIISMLDKFNIWANLQTKIDYFTSQYQTTIHAPNQFILLGKTMVINLYEFLKASDYYSHLQPMDEFNFLRHIRNGAAHNNKFYFKNRKKEWTIGENEIVKWNVSEIRRSLQDKPVFNDFINFVSIFMLAKFFSDKMKEIDKTKNEGTPDVH
jgi:hypothetical protein